MKISPEKKKEISERIQQKRKPKMNEIVQKIKTAWDNKTDSEKDEIYRKSRSHIKSENDGFLSRSEKKFAEMLNNRKIPFIYDFLHNKKHWDFLVNSEILVEIDGELITVCFLIPMELMLKETRMKKGLKNHILISCLQLILKIQKIHFKNYFL